MKILSILKKIEPRKTIEQKKSKEIRQPPLIYETVHMTWLLQLKRNPQVRETILPLHKILSELEMKLLLQTDTERKRKGQIQTTKTVRQALKILMPECKQRKILTNIEIQIMKSTNTKATMEMITKQTQTLNFHQTQQTQGLQILLYLSILTGIKSNFTSFTENALTILSFTNIALLTLEGIFTKMNYCWNLENSNK